MARTTFSGPVASGAGFKFPAVLTADLPSLANTADDIGTAYVITDNGVGNDETTLVIWNGTAWVTGDGQPLD